MSAKSNYLLATIQAAMIGTKAGFFNLEKPVERFIFNHVTDYPTHERGKEDKHTKMRRKMEVKSRRINQQRAR